MINTRMKKYSVVIMGVLYLITMSPFVCVKYDVPSPLNKVRDVRHRGENISTK